MASKKKTSKKKQSPKPSLGVLDHLFLILEQIISYFEVLYVYLRKRFNENFRETILIFLAVIYFFFLLFVGSSFIIHAGYLGIMFLTQSPILSSLILGFSLFVLSILFIRYFIKKILF